MKKIYSWGCLSLMAFLGWFNPVSAQAPANDLCSSPTAILSGQTLSGTTTNATVDNAPFCSTSNTAPGVWYSIVGNGGQLTMSTCNQASYDTKISIYSGPCANLVCEDGNDDGIGCTGFSSEVDIPTIMGNTYLVLVHGFSSFTGDFDITATLGQPIITNDDCADATVIACGQTINGTTSPANPDTVVACNNVTSTANGVWYKAVGNGTFITASLCSGTNYDSKLSVYTGTCSNLTCVASNDDFCGSQSEATWSSVNGQEYLILVHGFGSSNGAYAISMACTPPPPNDDPCNAQAIGFGTVTYNNTFASADTNEISPGVGSGIATCNSTDGWCSFETGVQNSLWYSFVAPAGGSVNVLTDGFDSQVAIYSVGSCGDYSTYTVVGANDDGANGFDPTLSSTSGGVRLNCLTPGATYYIQVDGFLGASTISGSLILQDNASVLPSVDAGDCQSIYAGYAPAAADTNFLVAIANGVGPFQFSWSVSSGDSTIIFQDEPSDSNSVIAVRPNQTTTYMVSMTDANGCVATDIVTVERVNVSCFNGAQMCYSPANAGTAIVLDWDTDGMGNALAAGTPVTNQYANYGINISVNNGGNGPNAGAIFDSSNPTGGDTDLGTPHSDFGGPGIGSGGAAGSPGQNDQALGNLLIIQERPQMCGGVFCVPDDEVAGGSIQFSFDDPLTVETIVIVDADDGNPSGAVVTIDANTGTYTLNFPSHGDNSVMTLPIFEDGVLNMTISFNGSGAVGSINLRRDEVTFCAPNNLIAGYLSSSDYHLGTCNDVCLATNPSIAPPPACVDLSVNVTTDDFSSETRWEVIDRTTGLLVGNRQFGFTENNQTFSDTFCVDPRHCYDVFIFDAVGDGICCAFGQGEWSVTYDGTNMVSTSNGSFGSSDTLSVGSCPSSKGSQAEAMVEHNALRLIAYPNPTNGKTTLKFASPAQTTAVIELFQLDGQKILTVFSGQVEAQVSNKVQFDASQLPSGVYIYRLVAGDQIKTGKLQVQH